MYVGIGGCLREVCVCGWVGTTFDNKSFVNTIVVKMLNIGGSPPHFVREALSVDNVTAGRAAACGKMTIQMELGDKCSPSSYTAIKDSWGSHK